MAKYTGRANNQCWWGISEGCLGNSPPLYMLKDPLLYLTFNKFLTKTHT